MRNKIFIVTTLGALAAGVIILSFPHGDQPARVPRPGSRSLRGRVVDFFGFGWHYSREVWARQSRDWPAMTRARLLGFEHRPDHPVYSDLRELSFFELGRVYERVGLPDRAAELYLRALKADPENPWLKKWVTDKLPELIGSIREKRTIYDSEG